MEVLELHHVEIHVTDIDRAVDFYKSVLGLTQIQSPDFGYPGAWFSLGHGQLHLMSNPDSPRIVRDIELNPDDVHFAIRVKSYSEALQRIKDMGIPYKASPHGKAPWPQIKIADPDGNMIEVNAAEVK